MKCQPISIWNLINWQFFDNFVCFCLAQSVQFPNSQAIIFTLLSLFLVMNGRYAEKCYIFFFCTYNIQTWRGCVAQLNMARLGRIYQFVHVTICQNAPLKFNAFGSFYFVFLAFTGKWFIAITQTRRERICHSHICGETPLWIHFAGRTRVHSLNAQNPWMNKCMIMW